MDGSWHVNENFLGYPNHKFLSDLEMKLAQLVVMMNHIEDDGVAIIRAKLLCDSGIVILTLLSKAFQRLDAKKLDKKTCGSLWSSMFSYVIGRNFKAKLRIELRDLIEKYLKQLQARDTSFLKVSSDLLLNSSPLFFRKGKGYIVYYTKSANRQLKPIDNRLFHGKYMKISEHKLERKNKVHAISPLIVYSYKAYQFTEARNLIINPNFEESDEDICMGWFFIQTNLSKLSAYGYRFGRLRIAQRYVCL